MPVTGPASPGTQPMYRIGAVARITGLSTHTLRKWEDRHGLIAPRRSEGGERIYSASDVRRLSLARDLARFGMPLGDLAKHDTSELEALLRETREGEEASPGRQPAERVDVAVLGTVLPSQLRATTSRLRHLRVLASSAEHNSLSKTLAGVSPVLLIVERPTITEDTAEVLDRTMKAVGAIATVVVYRFGTRAHLNALRRPEVSLVRAPIDLVELERHCLELATTLRKGRRAAKPVSALATHQRFSLEALARISSMSTDISCECPRHLADLIMSLEAFVEYSANCENRDDSDAALHRHLHDTAIATRALLEEALSRVVDHEEFAVDSAGLPRDRER